MKMGWFIFIEGSMKPIIEDGIAYIPNKRITTIMLREDVIELLGMYKKSKGLPRKKKKQARIEVEFTKRQVKQLWSLLTCTERETLRG